MIPENYLARIGYTGPLAPTHATLAALCRHHIAAIPFENIDALLGNPPDISAAAVDAKLIANRRGGWCVEHAGLFKRVLLALGYEVESLTARVWWRAEENAPPRPRTHAALRVHLDGQAWLVDVGFGGWVPPGPLLLSQPGPQRIGGETFRIASGMGPGSAMLEAEIDGVWHALYEVSPEAVIDNDYQPLNWFVATHPSSIFRQDLMMALTKPDVRYTLLNGRLTIRTGEGEHATERRELNAAQLEETLHDIFGLTVETSWRPLLQRLCDATAGK